jgi:hypothetical protein
MSANPLRTFLLVLVVAGFGTMAVGTSQFDSYVTHAASEFVASGIDSGSTGDHYTAREPQGMWSFEFE